MKNGAYVLASKPAHWMSSAPSWCATFARVKSWWSTIGYKIVQYTNNTQLAICSMEYIYFARPDSDIYGVNVHSARKRMGARLAARSPVEADMVIGVPNSHCPPHPAMRKQQACPTKWV